MDGIFLTLSAQSANNEDGFGKPLTIEILKIYTGAVTDGKTDLIVTTQVKGSATTGVAPRAVNQVLENVDSYIAMNPGAGSQGSPIVFHTPALDQYEILLTCNVATDRFDGRLLSEVGGLMATAGALPVFAPATGVLLVGSVIVKAFAKLGEALGKGVTLAQSERLRFKSINGKFLRPPELFILHDAYDLNGYSANVSKDSDGSYDIQVSKDGKVYRGGSPYVVMRWSQEARPDLKEFNTLQATAEHMEKFFRATGSATTASIDFVKNAVSVYNDKRYYDKALEVKQVLEEIDEDDPGRKELEKQFKAYRDNIQEDLFKEPLKEKEQPKKEERPA